MKKLILFMFSALLVVTAGAQVKSNDAELDKQLAEYLQYNQQMRFDKVMDFMHPSLFTVAPKEAMIAAMKQAFGSEEMEVKMEDMGVTGVGAVFQHAGTEYRKVEYKMTITIRFKDAAAYTPEFIEVMTASFTESFAGKQVSFDKASKKFIIKGQDILYAIRDAGKPWFFLGYNNNPELMRKLFPQAVIDHYGMIN